MSTQADVKFVHPNGRANVRPDLDAMLSGATTSLRAAVCYFTDAGRVLLSKHIRQLNQTDSFFVASVDAPTDLKALEMLHKAAPGHIHIHLGGTTPEEKNVGRSLMHSKVFLAEANADCSLWVGSHNLTARAIAGGNFEAGLICVARSYSPVIQDAIMHLEMCRMTAEPFNPRDMERYQAIQRGHAKDSAWDSEQAVLVIHAESLQGPTQLPFIVQINVVPTELDRLFRLDGRVRLFLHQPGTLRPGMPVDFRKAGLWSGEITAVVRTERHPKNQGSKGQFAGANYHIDIPNLASIPSLTAGGQSNLPAKTQVVIRFDQAGELGRELFSIGTHSPLENTLASAEGLELHEVDRQFAKYFTSESVHGSLLVYRPVTGVQQNLIITGFSETVRSRVQEQPAMPVAPDAEELADLCYEDRMARIDKAARQQHEATVAPRVTGDGDERIEYRVTKAKHPINPFLFLSSYAVRLKPHK